VAGFGRLVREARGDEEGTMAEQIGGTTPKTRLRRLPELGSYERSVVYEILDSTSVCHVAFVVDGQAMVLPTLYRRRGDTLLLHGSRSSRMLRAMVDADQVCVSVTTIEGLIVARSTFNSSVAYSSVSVFGPARLLDDLEAARDALDFLIEGILPGRTEEVRPSSDSELRRTSVVAVEIVEASAKISQGPPSDDDDDIETDVWAGVVGRSESWGPIIPAPDGPVGRGEVDVPSSVRRLVEGSS
jgi:uncharacterized protein